MAEGGIRQSSCSVASDDAEEVVCETQRGIVDEYCQTCQDNLCRHCLNVNANRTMIKGHTVIDKKKMPQSQRQELDEFHDKLKEMKHELDNNLKNLDTTFDNIQHKITLFRKSINEYLDQIQKQITDEAAEMKKTCVTKLNDLIEKNESMNSKLTDILQKKQAKQKLGKMKIKINKIEQSQQQVLQQLHHELKHYVFRPSIEIEKLVSANTPLGKLLRKPDINTGAIHRSTIMVQSKCRINDCTLLGPERMVVTDEGNNNIKLIDLRNKVVITSYKTSVPPHGVTAVSTDQVAVTLPIKSKIKLFKGTSTFTKQHEMQVQNCCYAIAYKDGKFAVAFKDPGRVEILDKQGQILHTIQGKDDKLRFPSLITFGKDLGTIIVAEGTEVSVVTFEGNILHTYTHTKCVSGIASTPDGVLFVCSEGSKSVHAVSSDFKTSKTIINTEGYPKSISYCDINHRLYITNRYSRGSAIRVYDFKV